MKTRLSKIGPEMFRAPEILFRPEMIGSEYKGELIQVAPIATVMTKRVLLLSLGVHDCLVKSVMKADMDLRRVLFSQMVLSGGSTMFPGIFVVS